MKKLLMVGFLAVAVVLGVMQAATSVQAAGGSCTCRGATPVCCRNCDGSFAYCARSYAFCPECAAP